MAISWVMETGSTTNIPPQTAGKQRVAAAMLAIYLSELEVAGNMFTPSGLAGTCIGGARYAGFEPRGRPSPLVFFADTRTKYGSPVSSSVIVYHKEDEFVVPVPSTDDDVGNTGARIVADD